MNIENTRGERHATNQPWNAGLDAGKQMTRKAKHVQCSSADEAELQGAAGRRHGIEY
jgi:hypothetical protein